MPKAIFNLEDHFDFAEIESIVLPVRTLRKESSPFENKSNLFTPLFIKKAFMMDFFLLK
jgi:hypothetical protein